MIKCKSNRTKNHVWVKAKGTAQDMVVEAGMAIATVYRTIRKENPEAAEGFKNHLLGLLLDPKSPIWKEDDHGKTAL